VHRTVTFFVPGTPLTKGSMCSFPQFKTGKIISLPSNKKLPIWESHVRTFAFQAWNGTPSKAPIGLELIFVFLRPKNHYRRGRYSHLLRDDAPKRRCGQKRYDGDKMERAVLDSLTGVVYEDDGQVWTVHKWKQYGPKPGVEVTVEIYDE